jgi:hypothetical protein
MQGSLDLNQNLTRMRIDDIWQGKQCSLELATRGDDERISVEIVVLVAGG